MTDHWTKIFIFVVVLASTKIQGQDSPKINATFITNAVAKGAVCLDGSPGAYFFDKGFGNGSDNWIVYLEGGGWCKTPRECSERTKKPYGTTKNIEPRGFGASISRSHTDSPDFYNWNRVFIHYCDGASFMATVEEVEPTSKVYRRGARIFKSVVEELLAKGMNNAKNAILEGNSAGGLATMLNCDRFRSFLPSDANVKCVADSGFFIQAKDVPGIDARESIYQRVTDFHQLSKALPESCKSRVIKPSFCLFPENFIGDIKTPLFIINSFFDSYQLTQHMTAPAGDSNWLGCTYTNNCTPEEIEHMKVFRTGFLKAFNSVPNNPSRGSFLSSCLIHDFLWRSEKWYESPKLEDKTIAKAVGDWFYDRNQAPIRLFDQKDTPTYCGQ